MMDNKIFFGSWIIIWNYVFDNKGLVEKKKSKIYQQLINYRYGS